MDYLDTEPPYVSGFGQSCNPRTDVRQLRLEFAFTQSRLASASGFFERQGKLGQDKMILSLASVRR